MRAVPDSYAPFYHDRGISISNAKAREQHRAYADALRAAGVEVHLVPADEAYPDCVFVEDPAMVWAPRALMGHLAPHREGEPPPVEAALRRWHAIERMPDGARLEGGDVLHAGDTTYVGLTTRTNEAGVQALRAFLAPAGRRLVAVPIEKYLHLKTAVTWLGDGTLVAVPDCGPLDAFEVDDVIYTDPAEPSASNCLRVGGHLLIPRGNPRTEVRLRAFAERHGVHVVPLDVSEFEKGEGSLTCLSILW
ncbi:MAG TPA: arginine deiminase family protein [Longimicrobium sp.]